MLSACLIQKLHATNTVLYTKKRTILFFFSLFMRVMHSQLLFPPNDYQFQSTTEPEELKYQVTLSLQANQTKWHCYPQINLELLNNITEWQKNKTFSHMHLKHTIKSKFAKHLAHKSHFPPLPSYLFEMLMLIEKKKYTPDIIFLNRYSLRN